MTGVVLMWKCTNTWKDRYDDLGIPCIIKEHAKRTGLQELCVVDVGCSKGVALKNCNRLLVKRGLRIKSVGIDQSSKVKKDAENNLDEFRLANVACDEIRGIVADVVICANALRWVSSTEKGKVVKKCSDFINTRGIFIMVGSIPSGYGRLPGKNESDMLESPGLRLWRHLDQYIMNRLCMQTRILNKTESEKLSIQLCSTAARPLP